MKKLIFLFLLSCADFISNRFLIKAKEVCETNGGIAGIVVHSRNYIVVWCENKTQRILTPVDLD